MVFPPRIHNQGRLLHIFLLISSTLVPTFQKFPPLCLKKVIKLNFFLFYIYDGM